MNAPWLGALLIAIAALIALAVGPNDLSTLLALAGLVCAVGIPLLRFASFCLKKLRRSQAA